MKRQLVVPVVVAAALLVGPRADSHEAGAPERTGSPAAQASRPAAVSSGLILAPGEGERLVRRQYGFPLTIKVDPVNGGSKHLVVGTEEIPPGRAIPLHKHSHADEFIVLQAGTATVTLGTERRTAVPGAMIFIPEGEWIGLENAGPDVMRILFVFSAPGFEEYLRATSVPEGQAVVPFSADEVKQIRERYASHIAFRP